MGVTDRSSLAAAFVIALAAHGILAGVPMPAFVTAQYPSLPSSGVLDVSIRSLPSPPASSPASSEDGESRGQEEKGRPEPAVPKMEQAPRPAPVVQKPKETEKEPAEALLPQFPAVADRRDVFPRPSEAPPRAGDHKAVETTPGDGVSERSERMDAAKAALPPSPPGAARKGPREEPVVPAAPRYRENPPPAYPPTARRRGYEGLVVLSVTVAADGRVREIALASSSGHDALDDAALQAVRRWRFEPATRGGVSVEMTVDVPVRFTLRREQAW